MSSPNQTLATLASQPDVRFTEGEITRLWQWTVDSKDDFTSATGACITVIDAGRPSAATGPDIRGVVLTADGVRRTGAVEIHQHPADWYRHTHHRDPAFNSVILQVCLHSADNCPARREDGRLIPTIPLTDELDELDLPVSPRRFLQRMQQVKHPCYKQFNGRGSRRLLVQLRRAALCWLYSRAVSLYRLPVERRLWQPLVGALGYTFNHRQFRCLARRLPPEIFFQRLAELKRPLELEAWLLGKGGWFQQKSGSELNSSIYRRRRYWRQELGDERSLIQTPSYWRLGKVRPQSYPYRRWLAFGWATRRLATNWRQHLSSLEDDCLKADSLRSLFARRLLPKFEFPSRSYWRYHYTFSDDRRASVPSPVGKKWFDQLLVNVIIPYFYQRALFSGRTSCRRRWEQIFLNFPPVLSNRRTRIIERQAGLEIDWPSAAHQQGAVFLYKHYCQNGRCGECSLSSSRGEQQRQLFAPAH